MSSRVLIRFTDGNHLHADLASSFDPAAGRLEVLAADGQAPLCYPFYDLCTIEFDQVPEIFGDLGDTSDIITVETIRGDVFKVRSAETSGDQSGFFARPAQEQADCAGIYFTRHGVRSLSPPQLLGEILHSQGLVERGDLDQALAEQKRLRKRRVGEILAERNRIPQETLERTIVETRLPARVRVGDILIAAGLVTRQQVEEALASQEAGKRKRIGELLIEKGLITEDQLLAALATRFNLRFVDLDDIIPQESTLAALPYELAARLNVFPIETSERHVVVATSTPTDPLVGDTLRFYTNRSIELVVARKQQIQNAIKCHYLRTGCPVKELLVELKDKVEVEEESHESSFSESDSQIINLVNRILIEAHQKEASDIHFEPGAGKQPIVIRYRVDGICRIHHQIAGAYKDAIIARLKIMARLDIAERRRPQSGKILLRFERKKIEYRLEITPTVGGREDAVLRLLSSSRPLPLTEMGFSPPNLRVFQEMLTSPYGVILCVGPTGSGKTTSLHSALGHVNTPERKIWTAEDPVEITQPGLRQVQVHPKIGFSFPEALRSFLRADPDIIMIGEMRDLETARIVVDASLTGHLVFSTLHTNSAAETICRMIEMGIDPINFSEALVGVLAQRLVRRLCPQCKRPYHPDFEEYQQLVETYGEKRFLDHGLPPYTDGLLLMRKGGCEACGNEGYKGRLAIHELLSGTPAMKVLLKKAVPAETIANLAMTEGMRTLRMDGIYKVFQGETDFEQILKVCL